jgi:gamma-glutamyl hercynylcysteine S-oxide synthase
MGALPLDLTARQGDATALAAALQASRHDTLAQVRRLQQALPGLQVPRWPTLNPPLWELGHIGWFQDFWLARNPQREAGVRADPLAPRHAPRRPGADALYNSSTVAHASRWTLALPDADATRADLADQLAATLALLAAADATADALYFFRLALVHEDMHHEAGLYMAHALDIAVDDARWQAPQLPPAPAPLAVEAGSWALGSQTGTGFAFDNELPAHTVLLGASQIDAQVLRWADYLPFVADGGYTDVRLWSAAGQAWLQAGTATGPASLRQQDGLWQQRRHGRWQALQLAEPACHLTAHEAEAWCAWAGRRLPTEAEWERAALSTRGFRWGDVWEWTASAFAPYPGFAPHPYRDYSLPWFDGRPVLRGGSYLTQPRMKHPRYRNFFPAHRNDVPAGFRSCAR